MRTGTGGYGTSIDVTVAIATKERTDKLRDTLRSLCGCTPPPAEVIVVDGDEAGSARPVAESFAAGDGGRALPISYVASEPGLTRQRNRALELASCELIVFVDDDVTFRPEVLGVLAGAYSDPAVVGATGKVLEEQGRRFGNARSGVRRFLPGGGREGCMTRFGYPRRIQEVGRARDVEFMPGCLMSARTSAARAIRFDEALPGYGLAEDEDFSYRLSRLGRIRYLPAAVIRHDRTGGAGSAGREFNRDVVVNRAYLFRKNFPQTTLARLQFALLIAVLMAHRAVNMEWSGLRGLAEGGVLAWRSRR